MIKDAIIRICFSRCDEILSLREVGSDFFGRITSCAEVGAVQITASRSNGRLGSGTQPGMPVVAGEMLVPFERFEDD